jgi:hypothetical protein
MPPDCLDFKQNKHKACSPSLHWCSTPPPAPSHTCMGARADTSPPVGVAMKAGGEKAGRGLQNSCPGSRSQPQPQLPELEEEEGGREGRNAITSPRMLSLSPASAQPQPSPRPSPSPSRSSASQLFLLYICRRQQELHSGKNGNPADPLCSRQSGLCGRKLHQLPAGDPP